jgi:hypothetical protein
VPPGKDATAVTVAVFPEQMVEVPLTFTSGVCITVYVVVAVLLGQL